MEKDNLAEKDLIERMRRGDEAAYQYVCTVYQDRIYNAALSIVQSVEEAEDVVQETLAEAFLKIDLFNEQSKLSTWLYRIAINKAFNLRRRWKAQKRFGYVLSIFNLAPQFDKLMTDVSLMFTRKPPPPRNSGQ